MKPAFGSSLAVIVTACLVVTLRGQTTLPAPDPGVSWLREHAIPLRTVEAGNGFADLQPLEHVVGDARIVALGEATHGTREFFQLKHRLLEFLATRMGFNVFAIEANMPEAYRVNQYVLDGKGDPRALLQGMQFWIWSTEEVLDMIRWMRAFNASGRGQVRFTGFDMQMPDAAAQIAREFVDRLEPAYAPTFEAAWRRVRTTATTNRAWAEASASLSLPPSAVGKTVRYGGYVKTEGVTNGYAALSLLIKGDNKPLLFDNMRGQAPRGTVDWRRCEISVTVPPGASTLEFGVVHEGNGRAWFDALNLEIDGVPHANTAAFDLDFESPSLRGFVTAGEAFYQIAIDHDVARIGRQSLRIAMVDAPGVRPSQASTDWSDVVAHLEASRAGWIRAGARAQAVDWAIQNARLVLQFAQLNAGERTRDRSMADNVRWIVDHEPGAKVVIWAHNLHVTTRSPWPTRLGLAQPMGQYLRETYGGAMVVFGFAFNQGSFRAGQPGTAVRSFSVSPAPAGTLDAALAATGVPIFAVDLRDAPQSGPVADWLAASRKARVAGDMFNERSPLAFLAGNVREMYDAMLFVEKTTASRPLLRGGSSATPRDRTPD